MRTLFCIFALFIGLTPATGADGQEDATQLVHESTWEQRPEAGVRLLGHSFPNGQFTLRPTMLEYSADGQWIIGVSANQLIIFSAKTRQLLRTITLDCLFISAYRVTGDQYYVVVADRLRDPEVEFDGTNEEDKELVNEVAKRQTYTSTLLRLNSEFQTVDLVAIEPLPIQIDADGELTSRDIFWRVSVSPNQTFLALSGESAGTRIFQLSDLQPVATYRRSSDWGVFLDDTTYYFEDDPTVWRFLEQETKREIPKWFRQGGRAVSVSATGSMIVRNDLGEFHFHSDGQTKLLGDDILRATLSQNGKWISLLRRQAENQSVVQVLQLPNWEVNAEVNVGALGCPALLPSPDGRQLLYAYNRGFSAVEPQRLFVELKRQHEALPKASELSFFDQDRMLRVEHYLALDVKGGLVESRDLNHGREVIAPTSRRVVGIGDKAGGFSVYVRRTDDKSRTEIWGYQLPEVMNKLLKLVGSEQTRIEWRPECSAIRFSEDENQAYLIISHHSYGDKHVILDLDSRLVTKTIDLEKSESGMFNNAVSANGLISVRSFENGFAVHDLETGKLLIDHQTQFRVPRVKLSRDGKFVAVYPAVSDNPVCEIYEATTGKRLRQWKHAISCGFSEGSNNMFVCYQGGAVEVYDSNDLKLQMRHQTSFAEKLSGAMSHDGKQVAFSLANCQIEIWNLEQLGE